MTLFRNKFRIKSARLPDFDYSMNGMYFITICTKERLPFFGEIVEGGITLSEMGEIVKRFWQEIPNQFSYVKLDEFVVMPNHFHGIVIIDQNRRDAINRVSTADAISINRISTAVNENTGGFAGDKNPMVNENLSRIIRWYKGRVSFEIKKIHSDFGWQSRFHDRIIRNEDELFNVRNYIKNNPANWENDKLMKEK
ncbi:MAG: transposase [Bacteroidetes bacterium]|nr:transposase [Bacteroidota bacterium]